MIWLRINGVEYRNVSSIEPTVVYDIYHDIQTLDGKRHRDVKGKRTNYNVVFFNVDFAAYDKLKSFLMTQNEVYLEIPNSYSGVISGNYLVTVSKDTPKGVLSSGGFYSTALTVTFEKVGYDE